MPNLAVTNIDPSHGQPGAGYCLLIQTSPGSGAPQANASFAGGIEIPMAVTELDAARGLWSAYMDDGPDFGDGVINLESGGCSAEVSTPVRD